MGTAYRTIIMRKIFIHIGLLGIFFFLVSGGSAFAQSSNDAQLCGSDPLSNLFCAQDLSQMVNGAFQISISLGAILAMLRIGYAGYLYMGSDFWSNKQHAKEVFRDAIIGLLILLAIYLILFQINPDILKLNVLQSTS